MKLVGLVGALGPSLAIASHLESAHGFTVVGLTDVMRRFCVEVFGAAALWQYELWGPESPSATDPRYGISPKATVSRLELWGRELHHSVWIDHVLNVIDQLREGRVQYLAQHGIEPAMSRFGYAPPPGVVVHAIRTQLEIIALRERGARIWRLPGPGPDGGPRAVGLDPSLIDAFVDTALQADEQLAALRN